MAKNKSKQHVNEAPQSQRHEGFSIDAQKIGIAIAGVLVSELVNAAVQRLGQNVIHKSDRSNADRNSENGFDQDSSNPLERVAAKVGDRVGEVESSAEDVAKTVRSSASNLTVNLSDVVDVLRDVGKQLTHQSANAISTSSETILGNVSERATAVLDRVSSESKQASKKIQKKKKNKKKKH